MNYAVEIRKPHPTGKIGFDHTRSLVLIEATSHEEAKALAEVRHKALVLSTQPTEVTNGTAT